MRIPATRIPLGFKASNPGDLGLDPVCAVIDKGEVQAVAAKAAEYPRNVLRFIFMFHRILVVQAVFFASLPDAWRKQKK
jgi:hypothetical protein